MYQIRENNDKNNPADLGTLVKECLTYKEAAEELDRLMTRFPMRNLFVHKTESNLHPIFSEIVDGVINPVGTHKESDYEWVRDHTLSVTFKNNLDSYRRKSVRSPNGFLGENRINTGLC